MFSRILKVGLLACCLVAAGNASADRNVVVPVLAGAAVGAVLVAVLANSSDDRRRYQEPRHYHRQPQPRHHSHHSHHNHRSQYRRDLPRAARYRSHREYVMVPVERRGEWRGGRY